MGSRVDKCSRLGIGTDWEEAPEAPGDEDESDLIVNWSRDLLVTDLHHDWKIHAQDQAAHVG